VPPAQLALATILQAYTGASDDEVIEAPVMDRRWQLVLDCLEGEPQPASTGTVMTTNDSARVFPDMARLLPASMPGVRVPGRPRHNPLSGNRVPAHPYPAPL
jgi:hypothetical protein